MAYGIEIFNSSGVKVLELSNRVARFVAKGSATTSSTGTVTVSITGMENNDSWDVIGFAGGLARIQIQKSTGSFTITSSNNTTIDYVVIRS